jgi:acyl-coenzyme A thioesterase PaaI-like protein
MDAESAVLSVEYKVNLLAPAVGERMRAIGRVIKPGRTLLVCTGEVIAVAGDAESVVTVMQGTMMAVRGRPGLVD